MQRELLMYAYAYESCVNILVSVRVFNTSPRKSTRQAKDYQLKPMKGRVMLLDEPKNRNNRQRIPNNYFPSLSWIQIKRCQRAELFSQK
jgi:hypothetical protein